MKKSEGLKFKMDRLYGKAIHGLTPERRLGWLSYFYGCLSVSLRVTADVLADVERELNGQIQRQKSEE